MKYRVEHIIWGAGYIEYRDERYVRIVFDNTDIGKRTFVWPDAFGKFLRYEDNDLQSAVESELRERERAAYEANEKERQKQLEAAAARNKEQNERAVKRKRALAYAHARNKNLRH